MGKPIRYVRDRELEPAIDRILFYASAARMIRGEVTLVLMKDGRFGGGRPPRSERCGKGMRRLAVTGRPSCLP